MRSVTTIEELDELNNEAIVQVVEHGKYGDTFTYYRKWHSGRGWQEMDPSDRDDGEYMVDAETLRAASRGYDRANHKGSMFVLFEGLEGKE